MKSFIELRLDLKKTYMAKLKCWSDTLRRMKGALVYNIDKSDGIVILLI